MCIPCCTLPPERPVHLPTFTATTGSDTIPSQLLPLFKQPTFHGSCPGFVYPLLQGIGYLGHGSAGKQQGTGGLHGDKSDLERRIKVGIIRALMRSPTLAALHCTPERDLSCKQR